MAKSIFLLVSVEAGRKGPPQKDEERHTHSSPRRAARGAVSESQRGAADEARPARAQGDGGQGQATAAGLYL